ncbi:MAG: M20/M25/M40 family metallo-hydrolase [Candidatus Acidiferrales bacterium]
MKRVMLVGLLLLIAVIPAGSVAQAPAAEDSAVGKIVASALGQSPLEESLRRLTDEIGGRLSGTPQMRQAVAWGVEAFRGAGVDDVRVEKFSLPAGWRDTGAQLEILAPATFRARAVSIGWSPAASLEADVVDVGDGDEAGFARAGERVRDALVLVHSEIIRTWADLFGEYMVAPPIRERARAAGAAGLLWMSSRERDLLYQHVNHFNGEVARLPQALVAREDALRVARLAASGQRVRARLTMPNEVRGPIEEENVVAEIRGREKPEEIVILGAHLDSWELGTGALDNGANSALVVEAARALRAAGARPRRTVRFVLFSGEEQGLHGSLAYVRRHRDELDRTVAVVIFDAGTGRVTGYSLGGRKDVLEAVQEVLRPVESLGADQHTADAFIGTDNFDFLLEGVPTLVANQEEANYIENYHASSDTFDKVDLRELKLHAALAAATVWGIAERPEKLGLRQSRADIERLLRETGLDQQLRLFEMWEDWADGRRGRQP